MGAFPGPRGLAHATLMQVAGRDTRQALDLARERHGEAFVFGFGPIRYHWFLGLDGAHLILRDAPERFGNRGAYGFLEPVGGSASLIASDDPEHLKRRRAVQPAFHARELAHWSARAELHFGQLVDGLIDASTSAGGVALLPRVRATMLQLVMELLLGDGVKERHPNLAADVGTMMDYANLPPMKQLIKLAVPGNPWRVFTRARTRADAAIRQEIQLRRAGAFSAGGGVLDTLLALDHDPQARLSEDELRDQALSLISAGFDTTTAAITWTAHALTHADFMPTVADELAAAGSTPRLEATPFTHALVNETLRLYPPAPAILRRVRQNVEFNGAVILAGSGAALSIYHLHRDARLWREPLRLQPQRWLDRDGDWAAPKDPLAFIPFGHGGRFCIGGGMARTMVQAFLRSALARARWTHASTTPPQPVGTTLVPDNALPLRWLKA